MPPLFETVANLHDGAEVLRRRAYGLIEAAGGRFRRVVLRPFPKLIDRQGVGILLPERCLQFLYKIAKPDRILLVFGMAPMGRLVKRKARRLANRFQLDQ